MMIQYTSANHAFRLTIRGHAVELSFQGLALRVYELADAIKPADE